MIIVARGHVLRSLGVRRKGISAAASIETLCGRSGESKADSSIVFFYPQLGGDEMSLLQEAVVCADCLQKLS